MSAIAFLLPPEAPPKAVSILKENSPAVADFINEMISFSLSGEETISYFLSFDSTGMSFIRLVNSNSLNRERR